MATEREPEIVLYDLACIKNVCFSPVVWRIRMILNYKRIPYKTIFLEFPDIEPTLKALGVHPPPPSTKYTVPTIHHIPTNTHITDSPPIAAFLTEHYPTPPLPLTTPLGQQIESLSRTALGITVRTSCTPREIHILSPRAQEFFRTTREATMNRTLESLLENEEQVWQKADEDLKKIGEMLLSAGGPFVNGAEVSYTDFFIAGSLQCIRVIDEGVWERYMAYKGFKEIYEACGEWLERKD
ncbi:hypothetical protein TWF694_003549 [Orbilia ellipsospora]|uniref:GST N-terminal domain-containing protein n=1 Tax=Orbilia ellipsospora TaxID=2528407 RepID=A0AAV9X0Q8_9PEZI